MVKEDLGILNAQIEISSEAEIRLSAWFGEMDKVTRFIFGRWVHKLLRKEMAMIDILCSQKIKKEMRVQMLESQIHVIHRQAEPVKVKA